VRNSEESRFSGRRFVALLAIFAISFSIATRTFHSIDLDHPSVQADPSHAMRQHLAADAVVLTNPVSDLGSLLLSVVAPHAPPVEVQAHAVDFTESLYNRPPPSISLL